jgi:hypothetical protein
MLAMRADGRAADLSDENMLLELRGYGAWDEDDLQDCDKNTMRCIWLAACSLAEEL